MAEKRISSTIVGPNGSHWCRVCKTFVRGTKISIQEHEQTGRHKHNYRESLKEKRFLEQATDLQNNVLADELRRMEREANAALGLPDVPTIAPPVKPIKLRLPSQSRPPPPPDEHNDELFVPKYVPVVRASASASAFAPPVNDFVAEAMAAVMAAPPPTQTAEPGEWTVVAPSESLEQQQESDAAAEEHKVLMAMSQAKKAKKPRDDKNAANNEQDDDASEADDDNGTVHSGPRHLESALATTAATATNAFKKRKVETKNRAGRKKLDDDDDDA